MEKKTTKKKNQVAAQELLRPAGASELSAPLIVLFIWSENSNQAKYLLGC